MIETLMTLHAQACVSTVGRGGKVKLAVPFFLNLAASWLLVRYRAIRPRGRLAEVPGPARLVAVFRE